MFTSVSGEMTALTDYGVVEIAPSMNASEMASSGSAITNRFSSSSNCNACLKRLRPERFDRLNEGTAPSSRSLDDNLENSLDILFNDG